MCGHKYVTITGKIGGRNKFQARKRLKIYCACTLTENQPEEQLLKTKEAERIKQCTPKQIKNKATWSEMRGKEETQRTDDQSQR